MSLRTLEALAVGEACVAPPTIRDPCVVCGVNPRAGSGLLTRCYACIKAAAAQDLLARAEAEKALAARTGVPRKVCRSCKRERPITDFARHRLSRDGHRHDCRSCCAAGRAKKRKPLAPEQIERERIARQQPHRKAANLQSVLQWQARNADAIAAHKAVDRAIRAGEIVPAKSCQAAGCKRRSGLVSHHNSYAANRRKRVIWLCGSHHRITHSGRTVPLKKSAPSRFARAPATT